MARRKRRAPAQCDACRRPVKWVRHRGHWWKFDPKPVDPRTHTGPPAYPIENANAWHYPALVEELMGRRECSRQEAEDEAHDMPWHVPHVCPDPDTNDPEDSE